MSKSPLNYSLVPRCYREESPNAWERGYSATELMLALNTKQPCSQAYLRIHTWTDRSEYKHGGKALKRG